MLILGACGVVAPPASSDANPDHPADASRNDPPQPDGPSAACAPGTMRCTASTPEQCDATGQWAPLPFGEPRWVQTISGAGDESLGTRSGVAVAANGDFLLAGRRATGADGDFHLLRVAPNGAVQWEHVYGTGDDGANSIIAIPGGAIACGYARSGSLGCTAGRLCTSCTRVDDAGTTVWQKSWPGSANDLSLVNTVVATSTGFLMTGATVDTDAWLDLSSTPVDLLGNAGTQVTFARDGEDQALDVRQAADGSFVAVGYTGGWRACEQPWLMRYAANGSLLSSYLAGPCAQEAPGVYSEQRSFAYAVAPLADGSAVMVGRQWDGANRFQGFIAQVTPSTSPTQAWRRLVGGLGDETFNAVEQLPDGGFLIAGTTSSTALGDDDMLVVRTDANGQTLWSHTYGGAGTEQGQAIAHAIDGSYAIVGTTTSAGAIGVDYYLVDIAATCP